MTQQSNNQQSAQTARKTPSLAIGGLLAINTLILPALIPLKGTDIDTSLGLSLVAFAFSTPILAICLYNSTFIYIATNKGGKGIFGYLVPTLIGGLCTAFGVASALWHLTSNGTWAFLTGVGLALVLAIFTSLRKNKKS
jgi:hypothetical protein